MITENKKNTFIINNIKKYWKMITYNDYIEFLQLVIYFSSTVK